MKSKIVPAPGCGSASSAFPMCVNTVFSYFSGWFFFKNSIEEAPSNSRAFASAAATSSGAYLDSPVAGVACSTTGVMSATTGAVFFAVIFVCISSIKSIPAEAKPLTVFLPTCLANCLPTIPPRAKPCLLLIAAGYLRTVSYIAKAV